MAREASPTDEAARGLPRSESGFGSRNPLNIAVEATLRTGYRSLMIRRSRSKSPPTEILCIALALGTTCLGFVACEDDGSGTQTDTRTSTEVSDVDVVAPDTQDPPDLQEETDDTVDPPDPPPDLAVRPAPGEVRAGFTTKREDLIGGPKAEGLVGDIKLWNHRAAFIVEGNRLAGGFRAHGGNVVDVDFAQGGEDRFGELWFAWNLQTFHPEAVEVVSDGRDGQAVVRFTGRTGRYTWVETFLTQIIRADPIDLAVTFEYRLGPDDNVLELVVTLANETAEPADVSLPAIAMNMGDGARNFAPASGLGGVTGNAQAWVGMIGLQRSYGFAGADELLYGLFDYQNVQILQSSPFALAPGESITQRYGYIVSDDGTTGIAEAATRLTPEPLIEVAGKVTGEVGWSDDEPPPSNTGGRSWVSATQGSRVHAITPVDVEGRFRMVLAPGTYELVAHAPQRGASAPRTLEVAAPIDDVTLDLPALGEVLVTVATSEAEPLPVQIAFFRGQDAPSPFSPSDRGFDVDWRHGRSAVIFSPDGLGRAHLLPGTYTVTASRGFSYTFAQAEVTVRPGESQQVALTIDRVVDDGGWVAADLHLHSIWSPDSDAPYVARLRQAAANDIVLPVFSEHVNIGHAHLFLDDAGVGDWVVPVPAQEVTTFEYGHFNSYPLEFRPDEPSFGAVFEHGYAGHELFDAIRAQREGDHIVQINHPRSTTGMFAYLGYVDFDRATAGSDNPRWTTDWDVIEVFNGDCGGSGGDNEAMLDWFAMNDHGMRKVLGSGSDSHSEAAGLGFPRSWIEVDQAAVEADVDALVAPMRARRTFVSCGPFVRFQTSDGVGLGEIATVDAGGAITFEVEVQAPEWIGLEAVELLENGVVVATIDHADFTPGEGAVRHRGTLTATPAADAWYVLVVRGSGNLWPIVPNGTPYAMTNPIEVDADRDARWTPPVLTGTAPARPAAARMHSHDGLPEHDHDH